MSVEARAGGNSSASTTQVSVRSLAGRWAGVVTGHTSYPRNRPIPINTFDLVINTVTRDGASAVLSGSWADDAGCRESRSGFIRQVISPKATAEVRFSVESLVCNDGDFILKGTADAAFDRVEGTCSGGGGANCRFTMVRR